MTLNDRLALSEARVLGLASSPHEAIRLITEWLQTHPDSRVGLDLLARLQARAGRLDDSIRTWEDALARHPGDQRIARSLVVARRLKSLRLAWLPALGSVVLVGAFLLGVRAVEHRPIAVDAPVVTPQNSCSAFSSLQLDNTHVFLSGHKARIIASSGLFERGTTITPEAAQLLAALGVWLRERDGVSEISITGHADEVPFPHDPFGNQSLAVQRAVVVMRELARHSGLAPAAFGVKSGAHSAPFPADSGLSARNRSATITLTAGDPCRAQ